MQVTIIFNIIWRFFYLMYTARKIISFLVNQLLFNQYSELLDAKTLRYTLMKMGCIWIKLGQWISERNDMFSQDYCSELKKLQASSKQHSYSYTKSIIEKTFGLDKIEYLGENVIGCGSIAQTHECRMIDIPDRKLIVKVKHPWVTNEMKIDILIVKFIIRIMKLLPAVRNYHNIFLSNEIETFLDYISTQDDLNIETYHYHIFRDKFKKYSEFVVPDVIYSNSEIIIMDYIEGSTYTLLEEQSNKNNDFTQKIIALYFKMLLFDGILHGDIHGGNIINNNNKIGLIDVGLVVRLGKETANTFCKLISSLSSNNINDMIESVVECSVIKPELTSELIDEIKNSYDTFFRKTTVTSGIKYIEKDFFYNIFGRHGFVLNYKIQHALLSYLLIIGHCKEFYYEIQGGMQYLHDLEGTSKKEKKKILDIKRMFCQLSEHTEIQKN